MSNFNWENQGAYILDAWSELELSRNIYYLTVDGGLSPYIVAPNQTLHFPEYLISKDSEAQIVLCLNKDDCEMFKSVVLKTFEVGNKIDLRIKRRTLKQIWSYKDEWQNCSNQFYGCLTRLDLMKVEKINFKNRALIFDTIYSQLAVYH